MCTRPLRNSPRPITHQLEMSAAARVDHYNEAGTAFTPKFGVKWKVVPQLALRGTFARGFRAPGIAESGTSSAASSTFAPLDPLRCGPGLAEQAGRLRPGYVAVLSQANPNLKPEHSKSYTLGVIVEPITAINFTADYFNITRTNEIVSSPLDPSQCCPRRTTGRAPTIRAPSFITRPRTSMRRNPRRRDFDSELRTTVPLGALRRSDGQGRRRPT